MDSASLTTSDAESTAPNRRRDHRPPGKLLFPLINLLASVQLVWFYVYRLPSFLVVRRYEDGIERVPFQARLLMQFPLHWAHNSPALNVLAARLTAVHLWIPRPVLPEDIVEAAIDLVCLVVAGLAARELYRIHSKTRLLVPFAYPLVLVMAAASYCLLTINFYRYVYDIPSLGLLSIGYLLIVRRSHPALFALLFVIATFNRETSLFLLYFFVASACIVEERVDWRGALHWKSGGTAALLALFWLGWHGWTLWRFSGLHIERGPGLFVNVVALFFPFAWPQLAAIGGYTLFSILIFRHWIRSTELRLWLYAFPAWLACMMVFGNLIETRLFGELIPIFAAAALLVAEEQIQQHMQGAERQNSHSG